MREFTLPPYWRIFPDSKNDEYEGLYLFKNFAKEKEKSLRRKITDDECEEFLQKEYKSLTIEYDAFCGTTKFTFHEGAICFKFRMENQDKNSDSI
ncbi:MAG: hypothetical protein QX194_02100 [Methylococcales bacterium]